MHLKTIEKTGNKDLKKRIPRKTGPFLDKGLS
jgi:hypothetical protein